MFKALNLPALVLIYALCLPAAVFCGYLLATPTSFTSLSVLSLVLFLLAFPLFIRWHHAMLVFAWNSFLIAFFLPGQPTLGILMAVGSLFISLLNRTIVKNEHFLKVPSVTKPLIFLAVIIVGTICFTGGIGSRALGSQFFGGKRYLTLLGAILGYFALTAQPVPLPRALTLASLYFLSALTAAISDLAFAAGPNFYFLFAFFSSNLASLQAITQETLLRLSGLTVAGLGLCYFLLMRFGIAGLLELSKPWRLLTFLVAIGASLFGGFRSSMITLSILFIVQFYFEGLFRTRLLPILLVSLVLIGAFTLPFVDRLPLSVQRSLSFLPIQVDKVARHDAMSTLDWRFQIWKTVLPEVPKYLWLGKGYNFSGTDYDLTQEAIRRGLYTAYEDTLISGNYHNGLLTIVIPFGIFAVIGFFWFCWASLRVLYHNYLFGVESLQQVNTFLLAFFVARLIFYLVFYGQFDLDFVVFAGAIGLSISLNHTGKETKGEESQPVLQSEAALPA
ncbi:MAG: O-antigen ligase family protein [Verrucomicrobiota bacterium]